VEALQDSYTPGQLLNDAQAKDTLYFRVWRKQDSVRCIYTGLARYLPVGVDPSQHLYGTGQEVESINLEHSWPQSKGAGEGTDGNVNMHHLFPSRSDVNADRADFPFKEIPDATTQRWYYRQFEMNTIPSNNVDAYSEYAANVFEPREEVKGDIARALFYFWTIYREDATAADPGFFNQQMETLCQWHYQDPVDEDEASRNEIIASYQDGKINPFISDCSLVMRAYCGSLPTCITANSDDPHFGSDIQLRFSATDQRFFLVGFPDSPPWNLRVFDIAGRLQVDERITEQEFSLDFRLPSGYYIAVADIQNQRRVIGLMVQSH
jgi:endonuclease I